MTILGVTELTRGVRRALAASVACAGIGLLPVLADAQAMASEPYSVSVFAPLPSGVSQPDSIVTWRDHVYIAFENKVAKDGTDGKSSTIIDFSSDGQAQRRFSVKGHNDGLRVVGEDSLWAVQNEDANPNLVVINLESGASTLYTFPATPHGGGYDDIIVLNGAVYLTASNPTLNKAGINVFPALVRARLWMDKVVLEPVLSGDASAVNIATGAAAKLNLTDPDSMTKDLNGDIVFVSQADSELVFVKHPGQSDQTVGVLPITSANVPASSFTIDDTIFAPSNAADLLVTDVSGGAGNGAIYRIKREQFNFPTGQAYSASDSNGIVGTLNVDNGVVTPIVVGLKSGRGLAFLTRSEQRTDGQGGDREHDHEE